MYIIHRDCRLTGPGHSFEAAVSVADREGADASSTDLPGDFEQVGAQA